MSVKFLAGIRIRCGKQLPNLEPKKTPTSVYDKGNKHREWEQDSLGYNHKSYLSIVICWVIMVQKGIGSNVPSSVRTYRVLHYTVRSE